MEGQEIIVVNSDDEEVDMDIENGNQIGDQAEERQENENGQNEVVNAGNGIAVEGVENNPTNQEAMISQPSTSSSLFQLPIIGSQVNTSVGEASGLSPIPATNQV